MKKKKPDPRQIAMDLGFATDRPSGLDAAPNADWPDAAPMPSRPDAAAGSTAAYPNAAAISRDPDSWGQVDDMCPIVLPPPPAEPPLALTLPEGPADFILPTRIAWAGRRPYSQIAGQLQPGDPVRLLRERDNPHDPHAILIVNRAGEPAGYIYAEEAAWLSLLFDLSPPERDESVAMGTDGRHVRIEIRLHLALAWPLFTIIAVFGLRNERFARDFNLAGNLFLQPLAALNRRYLANYDYFRMPPAIVSAFAYLRQRFDEARSARAPSCLIDAVEGADDEGDEAMPADFYTSSLPDPDDSTSER